jgi:hypothetical protein
LEFDEGYAVSSMWKQYPNQRQTASRRSFIALQHILGNIS